jgi:hypothetical protein
MKSLLLFFALLIQVSPTFATSYYLNTAAGGGNDSNNGLSPGAPWLSPNHAVNCGDTITAAPGTYDQAKFQYNSWHTVTCPSGNNVAWIICATFDACYINVTGAYAGFQISRSYWGVQGWEVTTTSSSKECFTAKPLMSVNIHHIVFANDIANGCANGGLVASSYGGYGVDYFAVVGSIAYNSTQGHSFCFNGISTFEPVALDTLPGTHNYFGGNFSFDNLDANPCNGGAPTDGEGLIVDTFGTFAYTGQSVIDNNIAVFNGSRGVLVLTNPSGAAPPVYVRHNTTYGNNKDPNQNSVSAYQCSEISLDQSPLTNVYLNLTQTNAATACGSHTLYNVYLHYAYSTDHIYSNYAYSAAGNNTGSDNSSGFTLGPNNVFTQNLHFANPVDPGAPSCGRSSSVPNCMATVIANFTPTAAAAVSYGYRAPSATWSYDPLFPQWLCSVTSLPIGLVTMGCLPGSPGNGGGPAPPQDLKAVGH